MLEPLCTVSCQSAFFTYPSGFEGLETKSPLESSVVVRDLPPASAFYGESNGIATQLFFIFSCRILEANRRLL